MVDFSVAGVRVVGIFVCEIGCILMIASISSNVWQIHQGMNDKELRIGLWESCAAVSGSNEETNCTQHLKGDVWLNAVRGLLLFGTACQLPPFALVLYFGPQNRKRMLFLSILNGIAVLSCVCGLAIFSVKVRNQLFRIGWSFILAWIAVGLDLGGAITALAAYRMTEVRYLRVEREAGLLEKDPVT